MPQFTIEIEGTERTVDVSDEQIQKAGFVATSSLENTHVPKGNVESIVKSRLADEQKTVRANLTKDPEFITEILRSSGVPIGDDGKPKLEGGMTGEEFQKQLNSNKEQWLNEVTASQIDPLTKANKTLSSENKGLRRSQLVGTIIREARAAGVDEDHFSLFPDAKEDTMAIVAQNIDRFAWQPDIQEHALISGYDSETGEPKFEYSGIEGQKYIGAKELFARHKADPETRKKMFAKNGANTTGLGDLNRAGGGKIKTRAEFDQMTAGAKSDFVLKDGGTVVDS